MWVLLMISFGLSALGGPVIITPLPKSDEQPLYLTLQECEVERLRIEVDMERSYPGEHDYKLECKKVPNKVI